MSLLWKIIIALTLISGLVLFLGSNEIHLLSPNQEVETRFLVADADVFYSSNKTGEYLLKKQDAHGLVQSVPNTVPALSPFLYSAAVTALTDNDGDENFVPTSPKLREQLIGKAVRNIFSFDNGRLIVYHPTNSDKVYVLDTRNNKTRVLIDQVMRLHDVSYSEKQLSFVVNYNNKLSYIRLNNHHEIVHIDSGSTSGKMNPFIYNDELYYSNNRTSEFFQLFKVSLEGKTYAKKLLMTAPHDLRLPKFDGRRLFYVEIIRNEYLLKLYDLKTQTVKSITTNGVVYNYHFAPDSIVMIAFSNLSTPKCILKYDLKSARCRNIMKNIPDVKFKGEFVADIGGSSGYIIEPNRTAKGMILFFHPGEDFSPRWDPILMNLCHNGYLVIAPNYPGSTGSGKAYARLGEKETIRNIQKWKRFIRKKYPGIKLYYLAYSSGNQLMEMALMADPGMVEGAISFFGIPAKDSIRVQIPSLYFLGKHDYRIHAEQRANYLKMRTKKQRLKILTYEDEGHMFRKTVNQEHAIKQTIKFLRAN